MSWVDDVRTALLISLSILVVVIAYRRFKRKAMTSSVPVPLHAELLALQVTYHPEQLRVEVQLPERQELRPAILDLQHRPLQHWAHEVKDRGDHVLVLSLEGHADGEYFFELATASQRTVRKFRLQRG